MGKKAALYLTVFVIVLECFARLHSYAVEKFKPALSPSFQSIKIKDAIGTKGTPYAEWRGIKLNRYGFHDNDDYVKEEKRHAIRIMCLGDSVTFSTFAPEHRWPSILEDILRSKGIDAEVINAAMPGNSYAQLAERFKREYIEFHPDILLIYKEFRAYMAAGSKEGLPEDTPLIRILKKSVFLKNFIENVPKDPHRRLLKERLKMNLVKIDRGVNKVGILQYERDLESLISFCRDNNVTLVLAPFVTLVNEGNKDKFMEYVYSTLYYYPSISEESYILSKPLYNEVTREVAEREGIAYIDVSREFKLDKSHFMDDYHLQAKGARLIAENYAEGLMGIIRSKFGDRLNKPYKGE